MKKNRISIITCFLALLILISGINFDYSDAKTRKKPVPKNSSHSKVTKTGKSQSVKSGSKSKTKSKKKKKKRKRRRFIRPIKMKYPENFEVIRDTILSKGISYKEINYGTKYKHHIHVIEANIDEDDVIVQVVKAGGLNTGLQKVQSMSYDYALNYGDTVVSMVNANFWRAGTNYPIGPTIIDGELVEMLTHKKWSAAFFNSESEMFIDNFFLNGDLLHKGKYIGEINKVNRRSDSTGIVMYNKYAGTSIPFISSINIMADIQAAFKQLQDEQEIRDSSDIELDSAAVIQELMTQKQMANIEFHLNKAVCRYVSDPVINKPVKCIVNTIGQGVATMPENGCIISFGSGYTTNRLPKPGDTLVFKFSTNTYQNNRFYQGVAGTPRIVRNGKPVNEAYAEGSKGARFIKMQLPRTAIGTDRSGARVFLVAVESTATSELKVGANLDQLAHIMIKLGAWNAMNLDGGGSTVMVIDNKNILFPAKPDLGRKVSVGLGIIKLKE